MKKFLYSVWFQDPESRPEDQDYEWVACFVILAESQHMALEWGDFLSRKRSSELPPAIFLKSSVEEYKEDNFNSDYDIPIVAHGVTADREEIGW